jgi:hypothetical protein
MKNQLLTFFGRLENEKGIAQLIQTAKQISNHQIPATLAIFGDGSKKREILDFATNLQLLTDQEVLDFNPEQNKVYYFGKRDLKSVIIPFLKKESTYSYMPSLMIETLGLSGLESIQAGIPIIGFKHGALTDLILDQHDLIKNNLNQILQSPSTNQLPNYEFQTKEDWLTQIKTIIPTNTKKIALLNDYLEEIGGTEKHIHQIKKLFEADGYQVKVLTDTSKINIELAEFNPEVIWVHNFLRKLKPKTLKTINQYSAFKIHTIHDLGLFTTFPSKFNNESLLPKSNSFSDFYKTKTAPLPITIYKWFKLIKPSIKELKKFNSIIVLHQFYRNSAKVYCQQEPKILPHFMD